MTLIASAGGIFNPDSDIVFTGTTTFEAEPAVGEAGVTLVGTTTTQTLTNKTLNSSEINTPTTSANIGLLVPPTQSTVVESGDGYIHQTVITVSGLTVSLVTATSGGTTLFYRFPVGDVTVLGATGSVTETTTSVLADTLNASKTYNWGLGTAVQANGTLATTEQDILPTTNGTSSATINVAGAASIGRRVGAPAAFVSTTPGQDVHFNVGIATASDLDATATTVWNGTITLTWTFNGAL